MKNRHNLDTVPVREWLTCKIKIEETLIFNSFWNVNIWLVPGLTLIWITWSRRYIIWICKMTYKHKISYNTKLTANSKSILKTLPKLNINDVSNLDQSILSIFFTMSSGELVLSLLALFANIQMAASIHCFFGATSSEYDTRIALPCREFFSGISNIFP